MSPFLLCGTAKGGLNGHADLKWVIFLLAIDITIGCNAITLVVREPDSLMTDSGLTYIKMNKLATNEDWQSNQARVLKAH